MKKVWAIQSTPPSPLSWTKMFSSLPKAKQALADISTAAIYRGVTTIKKTDTEFTWQFGWNDTEACLKIVEIEVK